MAARPLSDTSWGIVTEIERHPPPVTSLLYNYALLASELEAGLQPTMIHDSTPYCVLKISELARLIAGQLVLIDARNSAVNLACVCRSFEEPIFSTLWETQPSLIILLKVLPEEICKCNSKLCLWYVALISRRKN